MMLGRRIVVIGVYVWLSGLATASTTSAVTPLTRQPLMASDVEYLHCFYGNYVKNKYIMVNMLQEGSYGKIFQVAPTTLVTLNGTEVGLNYLREGMSITLKLRNRVQVLEIQVTAPGGN
jgi:hypothetical protein